MPSRLRRDRDQTLQADLGHDVLRNQRPPFDTSILCGDRCEDLVRWANTRYRCRVNTLREPWLDARVRLIATNLEVKVGHESLARGSTWSGSFVLAWILYLSGMSTPGRAQELNRIRCLVRDLQAIDRAGRLDCFCPVTCRHDDVLTSCVVRPGQIARLPAILRPADAIDLRAAIRHVPAHHLVPLIAGRAAA